jgi:hypothetical protein
MPSWPAELTPQQYTSPSTVRAQVWLAPAASYPNRANRAGSSATGSTSIFSASG